MATVSNVEDYLAEQAAAAIYPNGTSQPSIAPIPVGFTKPMDVVIYIGWPIAQQLDLDMAGQMLVPGNPSAPPIARPNGPRAHVSVNPHGHSSKSPFQILDKVYTIAPAAIHLAVTSSGTPGALDTQVTITGTPAVGEFVTIEADGSVFSQTGSTAAAVLSALLTQAQTVFPAASLNGSTLSIPALYQFVVRQGGVGTLGKVTHRQCQGFTIAIWAPDHHSRSVIADAIDVLLKETIVATMPDTSEARITYRRMFQTSEMQNQTIYRRTLFYDAEYATLQQFPGTTVTTVTGTIAAPSPTPLANQNFLIY